MENITKSFFLRLLVVLIAVSSPLICWFVSGPEISYSSYWQTEFQPLFIFTNAATSYFLFSIKGWRISSLFLMLLTAFNCIDYYNLHNAFAIAFFIFCAIPLIKSKRQSFYSLPYFLSIAVLLEYGIFWAEVCAIVSICGFHLHRLIKFYRIDIKRKN